jgi:two-component system cell cycle sensor histidine kinase/response regulator CckA
VEDDHAVMRATAATLKKSGDAILTAANGDEACRLIQRESDVAFLATARPDTPVIFMTGYSDYPIISENGDNRLAKRRAIMKPFRPSELLSIVREILDAQVQANGTRV